MKVTIETKATKTIELPKYFKNDGYSYFMLIDDLSYIKVYNNDFNPSLSLFPYIQTNTTKVLQYENIDKIEPISETEFKNAYLRVSLLIEETLSN